MATFAILKLRDPIDPDDPTASAMLERVMVNEPAEATKKDLVQRGVSAPGRYLAIRLDDLKIYEATTEITAV